MLIDSHCHVLKSEYSNPDSVIIESFNQGVKKIIINGYDLQSSMEAVFLAQKYENIYAAIGIGPQNIDDFNNVVFQKLDALASSNKVVAIGEIGLDYYWTKDNKKLQIDVFKNMLTLAKKHNLPVIVHSRKSFLDTYNFLKEYNVRGILHCYSGSVEMAKDFINLGFLIGIGGVVTFKNAKELINVVKEIDLRYLSLETDSPYLSPEPYRGKQNNPKNVILVAQKIAEIKGISTDTVIRVTGNSVRTKFDL